MEKRIITQSPEQTVVLAADTAGLLYPGDLVALVGELGAGKTMFVKGLAEGLKVRDRYVNSPSFVILKEYAGETPLYHFDVYRLGARQFEETLDYKRYFYGDGICVVEWADKIRDILPDEYLEIEIRYGRGNEREITFRPAGKRFEKMTEDISLV